jgi:hypothetical protein
MSAVTRFVGADGKFQTGKFASHVALRPWLWKSTLKLARDSALAAKRLCASLSVFVEMKMEQPLSAPEAARVKS